MDWEGKPSNDPFLHEIKNLKKTYKSFAATPFYAFERSLTHEVREDLRNSLAETRTQNEALRAALMRANEEKSDLERLCESQQKTIREFRQWSELVQQRATDAFSASLPPPPEPEAEESATHNSTLGNDDPQPEVGWLRRSPTSRADLQSTQLSLQSRQRPLTLLSKSPDHVEKSAALAAALVSKPFTTPKESNEMRRKAKAITPDSASSLRHGPIQQLLQDMDKKMEWRIESQEASLEKVSPQRRRPYPVTDEETTEHDDEDAEENANPVRAPVLTKPVTEEIDNPLSPANYLNRLLPSENPKEKRSTQEEDSAESVYSMFLVDNNQKGVPDMRLCNDEETVEVASSSGDSEESISPEKLLNKRSSDNSEVEIIDVDALPKRKAPSKRRRTRREDARPEKSNSKKRQRTLDVDPNDDDLSYDATTTTTTTRTTMAAAPVFTSKPRPRPRQRASTRLSKSATKSDDRKQQCYDEDEYSPVYVGGSSDEEREAERARKNELRRKEADDLRAFRQLLKEGAADQQEAEPAASTRGDGSDKPGTEEWKPLLRLPYSVNRDAQNERRQRLSNTEYARVEVVRKKDERALLPGHECEECAKFYDAIREGGLEFDRKLFVNNCSRHRSAYAAPDTPPHFWDLSFPETQPGTPPRP